MSERLFTSQNITPAAGSEFPTAGALDSEFVMAITSFDNEKTPRSDAQFLCV